MLLRADVAESREPGNPGASAGSGHAGDRVRTEGKGRAACRGSQVARGLSGARRAAGLLSSLALRLDSCQPWESLPNPIKGGGGFSERGGALRETVDYLSGPGKASFPRGIVVVWLRKPAWLDCHQICTLPSSSFQCSAINFGKCAPPPSAQCIYF